MDLIAILTLGPMVGTLLLIIAMTLIGEYKAKHRRDWRLGPREDDPLAPKQDEGLNHD